MIRAAAAWLIFVGAFTAVAGFGVYHAGILRRSADGSVVLYGWDAVRYLCPWIPVGFAAATALVGVVVWLLDGR